jgi:hypothetical protein
LSRQHFKTKEIIMAGKKNESTSKAVASKASRILSNPKSTAAQKSVAASALTQRQSGGKSGGGKKK